MRLTIDKAEKKQMSPPATVFRQGHIGRLVELYADGAAKAG